MPAYVVALIQSIHDPETYKQYVGQVEATLKPFGGRFLVRKPDPELLEGGPAPSRAIILEFPSEGQAREWHSSPGYQPVLKLRQRASQGSLVLLPPYEGAAAAKGGAFVLALIQRIHHMEPYKTYVAGVADTLVPFGGRFLARKADPELFEGKEAPSRVAIYDFPSLEKAKEWHRSPRYLEVAAIRRANSEGTVLILPAYAP